MNVDSVNEYMNAERERERERDIPLVSTIIGYIKLFF